MVFHQFFVTLNIIYPTVGYGWKTHNVFLSKFIRTATTRGAIDSPAILVHVWFVPGLLSRGAPSCDKGQKNGYETRANFERVVHKAHCNRLTNFIKVIDNLLIHLVMNEIRFLL